MVESAAKATSAMLVTPLSAQQLRPRRGQCSWPLVAAGAGAGVHRRWPNEDEREPQCVHEMWAVCPLIRSARDSSMSKRSIVFQLKEALKLRSRSALEVASSKISPSMDNEQSFKVKTSTIYHPSRARCRKRGYRAFAPV